MQDDGGTSTSKGLGLAGKTALTLFLGVCFIIGLGGFAMLGKSVWREVQKRFWTRTDCRILSSGVTQGDARAAKPYTVEITYEYDWQGRTRASDRIQRGGSSFSDYGAAQSLAGRYSAGQQATCLVNPKNPGEAVLIAGTLWHGFFLLIPLVFMLVGGGGIAAVWLGKWSGPASGVKQDGPVSARAGSGGAGCLVLFFAVFLLAGLGFFLGFFIRPVWKIQQARGWEEVPCVVESSQVRSHRGDDGTTYRVDILYRYDYGGRQWRSSRYHFMVVSSSGRKGKQDVVRRYPPGRETVCYVNPDNPGEAVLNRDFTPDMWLGLFPLVFVAVGVAGVTYAARLVRRGARGGATTTRTSGQEAPQSRAAVVPMGDAGPVELKVRSSRVGKLLAMLAFALFWNGIVSVFVAQVFKSWQRDSGGFMEKWFLPVFLIPFVLIGLFLIYAVFHSALGLFNPRVRLRLSTGRLIPGTKVDVEWRVEGRYHLLEKLTVVLEGREEATYQRGTRTSTDTLVFARIPVAAVRAGGDLRGGRAVLAIPAETMPSFEASHNKIIWAIHVKGTIRRWPDVEDEFVVHLLPDSVSS